MAQNASNKNILDFGAAALDNPLKIQKIVQPWKEAKKKGKDQESFFKLCCSGEFVIFGVLTIHFKSTPRCRISFKKKSRSFFVNGVSGFFLQGSNQDTEVISGVSNYSGMTRSRSAASIAGRPEKQRDRDHGVFALLECVSVYIFIMYL